MHAAVGPLAGTGRIADDLYLMAHDEYTGRPLIGPRLLGTRQAGYLQQAPRKLPWKAPRWVPVNPDWAYTPLSRACRAAAPDHRFDPGHAVLAGVAVACGLGFRMTGLLPAGRSVEDATRRLNLPLQHLISVTQTAVGAAVLAHRT